MFHQSCKNDLPPDRLYSKIRSSFVENVHPLQLRFYIECLTRADEERILETFNDHGRTEAASLMLRLLTQRPGWEDQLLRALREPQINLNYLADEIESRRREVLMVMDIEGQEEPMDVDEEPESSAERFQIFRDVISRYLKELVNTPDHLEQALRLVGQMNDMIFRSGCYGCLELSFQVRSVRSLHNLRTLYKGGALRDALSRGILTMATRQRIQKEAASRGVKVTNLSLTLTISDEDFSECERFLEYSDLPSPSSYVAALATPVDALGEEQSSNVQMLLDELPPSYQKLLEEVISLTFGKSELQQQVMTMLSKPLCDMIKESMDRLHTFFSIGESVRNDLTKIGLNLLIRSFIMGERNVHIATGDKNVLVWGTDEKEFVLSRNIGAELLDPSLSSPVDTLMSLGWLALSPGQSHMYYIPGSVRRAYLLCHLLPLRVDELPLTLFLDPKGTLDSSVDFSLFSFSGIFLAYTACYSGQLPWLSHFPTSFLYFPDVALFMSSIHAHETSTAVKDNLNVVLEHFEFRSFLTHHKSSDVDRHWKTWKRVGANFGLETFELINKLNLDSDAFEEGISVVKETLLIGKGNVVPLASKASDYNFQLAFRCVALLDLLQCVESVDSLSFWRTDSAKAAVEELPEPTEKTQPMSSSHQPLIHKYSGSSENDTTLESAGCLSLDACRAKRYTSTRASDWSFKLDMSKTSLDKEQVSLLCKFLPQYDHITNFIFNNSGLETCELKQIILALDPATVRGLSLLGCSLNLDDGKIGLSRLRYLESLDLEDTDLTDSMMPVLVKEIKNMGNLKAFSVGCNHISSSGFAILSSALISKAHLKALRIHNIPLGDTGGVVLGQLVFALKHLEILSIWGCNIGDEGVRILSEQLTVHGSLKRLSMRNNNMTCRSSPELCKRLSACRNIQFIDCSSKSGDTDRLSESLLILFRSSTAWDHVSLWDFDLGKMSIFDNPSDLENLSNVTFLCLQKNGLADDNIKRLATCLLSFRFLHHLNLRENMVGDEGAHALASALCDKEHLEELLLDWNIFSMPGARDLIELALELDNLKSCDLSFSFQLAPPEKQILAQMVGTPVQEGEGDLFRVGRGQLVLRI
ncbi:uncharacterized protein [Haliotis cracherodii]|uniref:uncharacterized protein isoform X1 n=2 Tax=Haliotis cracherodii TaxID=6455 RepID=UPI0039EADCC0